jgi:hypothetical protein
VRSCSMCAVYVYNVYVTATGLAPLSVGAAQKLSRGLTIYLSQWVTLKESTDL